MEKILLALQSKCPRQVNLGQLIRTEMVSPIFTQKTQKFFSHYRLAIQCWLEMNMGLKTMTSLELFLF